MRVAIVATVDWFVLSHRAELVRALTRRGVRTTVICHDTGRFDEIKALGAEPEYLDVSRASESILQLITEAVAVFSYVRRERYSVLHFVGMRMILIGCLISPFVSRKVLLVFAVAGLGGIFEGNRSGDGSVRSKILQWLFRLMFNNQFRFIFQNKRDLNFFSSFLKLAPWQHTLTAGSGVDLNSVRYTKPRRRNVVRVVMASRLLGSKGVLDFIKAGELVRDAKLPVEMLLAGRWDPDDNDGVDVEMIYGAESEGHIKYLGHVDDVPRLYGDADIVALPSFYNEGIPKGLIEALAVGRPIVTCDLPGCSDCVADGENGILVEPRSPKELFRAIEELSSDVGRRVAMGIRSRRRAERNFDVGEVVKKNLQMYGLNCSLDSESRGVEDQ